jgi:UPF0716 protein FxsA
MLLNLLAGLVLLFLADLFLMVQVGERIGFWPVFGIIVIFGAYGISVIKKEGFSVFRSIRRDLKQGVLPGRQLLNALLTIIGGILLLIPGLLSALAGFLLILPATQSKVREWILLYLRSRLGLGLLNVSNWSKKRRLK